MGHPSEPDGPQPDVPAERDWRIDRRVFLGGAAALTGAAAIEALRQEALLYRNANAVLAGGLLQVHGAQKPTFSIDVHRREDFLFLRVDGYNLIRSGQRLMRKRPRLETRLVVTFGPQHLAEQAYDEGASTTGPGSFHALVAGPSRLAFSVPRAGIPLTIANLLSWSGLMPALAPAAAQSAPSAHTAQSAHSPHSAHPAMSSAERGRRRHGRRGAAASHRRPARALSAAAAPPLREPHADETAIELPYHLALSPTTDGRWTNQTEPVTLNGATEMWRTELFTPYGSAQVPGGAVRAVWNYDTDDSAAHTPTLEGGPLPTAPFKSSLDPFSRLQIVRASADFTIEGRADIAASRLQLSARGGSLISDGSWNAPQLQISEWSHQASQGRDQYVKVVNKGFLFPFGHPVSLVTITQREFDEIGTQTVGVLRQTIHLVVAQPMVSYDPAVNPVVANGGRDFPFRSIELVDTGTPTLNPIVAFFYDGNSPGDTSNPPPFVPTVSGQPVSWHFVGTDWSGKATSFGAQAIFVSYYDGIDGYRMTLLRQRYNALDPSDPLRTTDFGGKTLTFAESYAPGDTDLPAYGMTFAASPGRVITHAEHESTNVPAFVPSLSSRINGQPTGAQVAVSMPAVEQAAGAPLSGTNRPTLAYYAGFVENGFHSAQATANQGNVFMEMLGDATKLPSLTFDPKSAGGVMTPNLQLQGLSRSLGPVGDLDNIFQGNFNPSTIFQALDGKNAARILGGIKLSDILDTANLLDGAPSADVPNPQGLKVTATRSGEVATTVVKYSPKIKTVLPPGVPQIITSRPDAATNPQHALSFNLTCTITTDVLSPQNSKYSIHGELDNFIVNLVSTGDDQFISITFNKFSFDSVSGGKPKLGVKIDGVNFDGALKFVEQLAAYMGLSGGGGPSIADLADSIAADLSIKLPSIDVGILSLDHIAIDTGFKLPFDGGPALFNFGFSTPQNPFTLAVGIFGGGGFLTLSLGTVGVKEISASFEFGAMAALDIGVASGSVSLTAGFYFSYAVDTTKVDLTKVPPPLPPTTCVLSGFVKLTGNLSVLDIITLSLEFDLTLTYLDPPGSLTGTAQLVVSISLLFFHKSVTLTATKTFVNGSSSSSSQRSKLAGHRATLDTPQTFGDQMTQSDWNTYCQAFAPVS